MNKVKVIKAYQKGTNAVFILKSVQEDPFLPPRTCFFTKPFNSFKSDIQKYVGAEYEGRIVFDEAVNAKPKTAFNLVKRHLPEGEIILYGVYNAKNQFIGFLERYWRYTKSQRSDYKINREEFSIVPKSITKEEFDRIISTKVKV